MVTKLVVIRYIMSQSKGPQVPVLWGRHRSVRWGCVRPHYHLVISQKRKNHWFKPSAPTHHEAGTYFSRMPMILASSVRLTDLPVSRAVSNVRFAELPTPLHKLTPWGPTCVWRWTTLQPCTQEKIWYPETHEKINMSARMEHCELYRLSPPAIERSH